MLLQHEQHLRSTILWLALVSVFAAPLPAQQSSERPTRVDSTSAIDSLERFIKRTVTVSGFVRDTAGRAVPNAEVRAGEGEASVSTLSNVDGSFFLRGAPPDSAMLSVRRIGYEPVDVTLTAKAGLQVDLAIRLTPVAVTLGTVVVEGKRMNLDLMKTGFYDRQRLGRGTFFGPEYLERHGGSFSALMREVPSVTVKTGRAGQAVAYGRNGPIPCALNVFIDGMRAPWANVASDPRNPLSMGVGLEDVINKRGILAVEVYSRATQMPPTLSGPMGSMGGSQVLATLDGGTSGWECGAIVIWTKPFAQKPQAEPR